MSDLSLYAGSSTNVNKVNQKANVSKASTTDLPPLNIKSANDRRSKYGKVICFL